MHIAVDFRIPDLALRNLAELGELIPFASRNITYNSISGHPDVFACKTPKGLVMAPNTPREVISRLKDLGITFALGDTTIGSKYPESTSYNAFVNDTYLIHHLSHTDISIKNLCNSLQHIHVNQAYTRCNLIEAKGLYITSDRGIEKALATLNLDSFFIDPTQIMLPGEAHGFFGGCAGTFQQTLFLLGSCSHFSEGSAFQANLKKKKCKAG
jgi:hypothetical protein